MRVATFVSRKFYMLQHFSWLAWKMTLSTNISFPKALLKVIFLFPRWVSKVPTPPRRRCDTRSRRYNTSPVRNDHFFCLKHLWKGWCIFKNLMDSWNKFCVDHACWMISSSVHHHIFVWRCDLITVYWVTFRNLPCHLDRKGYHQNIPKVWIRLVSFVRYFTSMWLKTERTGQKMRSSRNPLDCNSDIWRFWDSKGPGPLPSHFRALLNVVNMWKRHWCSYQSPASSEYIYVFIYSHLDLYLHLYLYFYSFIYFPS